jgi:RimJ/RimL family protein N-acetyltransferase
MLVGLERKPFSKSLQGTRIKLVRAQTAHAEALWPSVLRDRELRGSSWPSIDTLEEFQNYFQELDSDLHKQEVVYVLHKDDTAIGSLHIFSFSYPNHRVEIGYGIERNYEGQGLVSEAIAVVEAELRSLGFNRVEIRCNANNERSVALAKYNKYDQEACLKHECIEDGVYRDTLIFAKLLRST